MLVAADNGLDVTVHLHRLEEAGIQFRAADMLSHMSEEVPSLVVRKPEAVVELCGRDMEEGQ